MNNSYSVSKRSQNVIPSPIRRFLPKVLEAEKKGIYVYKINVGDPDLSPPKSFFAAIRNYSAENLGYAPSPGIKEHVSAWINYYSRFNIFLKPENIVVTVGAAEGMLLSMTAVCDPGDELLIFEPFYSSYKGFAAMLNIKLVPITLDFENNFSLPKIDLIESKISPKTKGIIIINPNNPTGTRFEEKDLKEISDLAVRRNLFILSDETYREIIFKGKPVSILNIAQARENSIVIDSLSKRFSCPGARIGAIASHNQEVMASILKMAMIRLSAPTIEQFALVDAINNSQEYTDSIKLEYQKRRDTVMDELKKISGVKYCVSNGAFYMIARLPIKDADDFAEFMIEEFNDNQETVLVTPAKDFYASAALGKNEIRIAYVLDCDKLKRAIEILGAGLNKYLSKK